MELFSSIQLFLHFCYKLEIVKIGNVFLNAVYIVIHLIFTTTLYKWYHYYPISQRKQPSPWPCLSDKAISLPMILPGLTQVHKAWLQKLCS